MRAAGRRVLDDLRRSRRPWIIAHRGYKERFPENTMAAFQAAVAAGADMIELDVTLTADRVPVVIHDDTLDRTTDGAGSVHDFTMAELAALDAGSWLAPAFRGERLPSLEQVLAGPGREIALNIELKPAIYEESGPPDALEAQVVEMVRRHDLADSVVLSSFEHRYFERTDGLAFGLLFDAPRAERDWLPPCRSMDAFSCHPNAAHLLLEDVVALREAGLVVLAFAADAPTVVRRLHEWGVDGVITDDPGAAPTD